jgi:hypothetical protein
MTFESSAAFFVPRITITESIFSSHEKPFGPHIVRGKQAFCSTFSASTYIGRAMLRALIFFCVDLGQFASLLALNKPRSKNAGSKRRPLVIWS